jgi:Tol biopolymer transport system component
MLGLCLLLGLPAAPTAAQTGLRCFDETGYCISGPIRASWEQNGGISVFGFPITPQRVETVEGRTVQVQWFERDRLEIQADGQITAGRLGARYLELQDRSWFTLPQVDSAPPGCRYFAETRHSLCEPFLSYWEQNGGLERFGYPISEPLDEEIEGQTYEVQYFERRRMELHPELPGTPVLLGLLGREVLLLEGKAPTSPPAGNAARIVFMDGPTNGGSTIWNIFTANPDGSNRIQLTDDGGNRAPSWSPDRSRIAYARDGNIFVMNADGSGVRQLTDYDYERNEPQSEDPPARKPAWSPDGSQIAFAQAGIFVMTADGRAITNLTNGQYEHGTDAPAWTADGRIVFTHYETRKGYPGWLSNLYMMNRDGTGATLLYETPGTDESPRTAEEPAVSPDGAQIAFYEVGGFDNPGGQLFVVNSDGSGLTNLGAGTSPAWSPDGSRIIYNYYPTGSIAIINPDGTGRTDITSGANPDW